MTYTKQDELGLYGFHWGCVFTCALNVIEHEIRRKITRNEIYRILGFVLLEVKPSVRLCNYKDHLFKGGIGWDEIDNPEWHFYVNNLSQLFHEICYILGEDITKMTKKYRFTKWGIPNKDYTHTTVDCEDGWQHDPADQLGFAFYEEILDIRPIRVYE